MANHTMAMLSRAAEEAARAEGDTARAEMHAWNASRYDAQTTASKPRSAQRDSMMNVQHQPKNAPSLVPFTLPKPGTGEPSSQKQRDFIRSLIGQAGYDATEYPAIDRLTKAQASKCIQMMLDVIKTQRNAPKPVTAGTGNAVVPAAPTGHGAIPEGRYLVDGRKVKVSQGDSRGKWAGWTFIRDMATDSPIRGSEGRALLDTIATDPIRYAVAYGRKTGSCGICGRTLTDPESVANGIGPICAEKY